MRVVMMMMMMMMICISMGDECEEESFQDLFEGAPDCWRIIKKNRVKQYKYFRPPALARATKKYFDLSGCKKKYCTLGTKNY